jgi:hypothetical protein
MCRKRWVIAEKMQKLARKIENFVDFLISGRVWSLKMGEICRKLGKF